MELVFKFSVSEYLLLAYRNTVEFYIELISCHLAKLTYSYFVDSIRFSIQTVLLFMNKDSFTSPFPIWMVFLPTSLPLFLFLFSLPYCTSWNLLTRLNRSSEHMSLFCTCSWGKTFSPSPSSMMLAVGIIKLRKFSSTPSQLRVFIRNG